MIAVQQGDTKADTATVTITAAAPTLTAVEVTPATASVAAGATQQFSAVGRMSDNSTSSVTVTWSATGGTITTGGLYTAGATAGSYRVIAVQQGGTQGGHECGDGDRHNPAAPVGGDGEPECVADGERAAEERDGVHGAQRAGDGGGRLVHGSGDGSAGVEGDERVGTGREPVGRTTSTRKGRCR